MAETTRALMRHQNTFDVTAPGRQAQKINVGQMERGLWYGDVGVLT